MSRTRRKVIGRISISSVIVNHEKAHRPRRVLVEDRLRIKLNRELAITKTLRTPGELHRPYTQRRERGLS